MEYQDDNLGQESEFAAAQDADEGEEDEYDDLETFGELALTHSQELSANKSPSAMPSDNGNATSQQQQQQQPSSWAKLAAKPAAPATAPTPAPAPAPKPAATPTAVSTKKDSVAPKASPSPSASAKTSSAVAPMAATTSKKRQLSVDIGELNPPQFNTNPSFARCFVIKSFTEDDVFKSLKVRPLASSSSSPLP
jgi:hypothetical protein